jgi:hypothetical protein
MRRLFTFGCSITEYSYPAWPEILAYDLQIPLFNFGQGGAGNQYIFNMLMQADAIYNFTPDDLVIVCWTNIGREDRFINQGWITKGNIFNQNYYSEEFVKKYVDILGFAIRDFAFIHAVDNLLKLKNINYYFFQTADIKTNYAEHEFWNVHLLKDIFSKNSFSKLLKIYSVSMDKILPSFHEILWNNDIENKVKANKKMYKTYRDLHPSPLEHFTYLKKILNHNFSQKTEEKVQHINNMFEKIIKDEEDYSIEDSMERIHQKFILIKKELLKEMYENNKNHSKKLSRLKIKLVR